MPLDDFAKRQWWKITSVSTYSIELTGYYYERKDPMQCFETDFDILPYAYLHYNFPTLSLHQVNQFYDIHLDFFSTQVSVNPSKMRLNCRIRDSFLHL